VADRTEPFVSRVRAGLAGRTAELERLAVEMFARSLSTRDIEAAFKDATGTSRLSRTAVSQVTERLWDVLMRAQVRATEAAGVIDVGGGALDVLAAAPQGPLFRTLQGNRWLSFTVQV
jgi:Transposase, Mutator family